jgi:hypothetical protein
MTTQISPLRQRMLDDMAMRNMSPNTQKVYTYAVANFAWYHHQSPAGLRISEVIRLTPAVGELPGRQVTQVLRTCSPGAGTGGV